MKVNIAKTTTQADLERVIAEAVKAGANCAQIKPAGKRGHVYGIEKVVGFLGTEAEIIFGKRAALGLPIKPLIPGGPDLNLPGTSTPAQAKAAAKEILHAKPAPAPAVTIKVTTPASLPPGTHPVVASAKTQRDGTVKVSLKAAPNAGPAALGRSHLARGSGYMAFIDESLHTFDSPVQTSNGYRRSKYTVDQVVQRVLVRFPGKNPASVKRVIKVRPRHLEKIKTSDQYGDGKPAPRWKLTGVGMGTGYMARIDQLLSPKNAADKLTTRQIAEIVCKEFGKDMELALRVVRVRLSHYEKKHGKAPVFIRKAPKSSPVPRRAKQAAALKRKNEALLKAEAKGKKKKK